MERGDWLIVGEGRGSPEKQTQKQKAYWLWGPLKAGSSIPALVPDEASLY